MESNKTSINRRKVFITLLITCLIGTLFYMITTDVWQKKLHTENGKIMSLGTRTKHKALSSVLDKRVNKGKVKEKISVFNRKRLISTKVSTHVPNNQSSPTHPKMLLIVAYLRTGSTFTASLFTQSTNSFYVFEPLHKLHNAITNHTITRYLNGTVRRPVQGLEIPDDMAVEALEHWFHCGLSHIDMASLQDRFHYIFSKSMRPFYMCVRHRLSRTTSSVFAIKECMPWTERKCNTASLRVIKTIRTRMTAVQKLMKLNPNMKVLHLVRDPRGMFYSQMYLHMMQRKNYVQEISRMCKNIDKDLEVSKKLLIANNKNFKIIRYEDLANDPTKMVQELYKFAELDVTSGLMNYVRASTSLNLKDTCPYCTRRSNSSKTASKWQTKIKPSLSKYIFEHCKKVYAKLGYIDVPVLSNLRNQKAETMIIGDVQDILLKNKNNL